MKKYLSLATYIFFLAFGLLLYYSEKLSGFITTLSQSDESIMMSGFNILSSYFASADTWNWFFVLLAIATALDSFVLIDLGLGWCLKKIFKTNSFINGDFFKMFLQKAISLILLFCLFVAATNLYVNLQGKNHSLSSIEQVPDAKPTLVLGTSKMLSSGKGENLYYTYRINTALDLWQAGKVDYFIISGDGTGEGHKEDYNEIRDITNDLVSRGIPAEKIKQDTAGYRTLDSMLRIRQMFCTKELVIVSQGFHVARAVVLAGFYGIKAIGMPSAGTESFSMLRREILSSKPKLMLDILFANMQPQVQVESTCMKNQNYRSAFSVKSDLHIILILLIGVCFISSMGLMFKYIG